MREGDGADVSGRVQHGTQRAVLQIQVRSITFITAVRRKKDLWADQTRRSLSFLKKEKYTSLAEGGSGKT